MRNTISKIINYFYTITVLLTAFGLYIDKNYRFLIGLAIVYIGYMLFIFLDKKLNLNIKLYIKVSILLTLILHNSFGQYFNLYLSNEWFDKILHIIGTFAFSLLFFYLIHFITNYTLKSKLHTFIFIFSLGVNLGVFFEIGEFALDMLFKSKHQHSLVDTNLDLIFNSIGAVISGMLISIKNNNIHET